MKKTVSENYRVVGCKFFVLVQAVGEKDLAPRY